MAETVRERIIAGIATDLEAISVANGYENDFTGVQRFLQSGISLADVPCLVVNFDEERKTLGPSDRADCELRIIVDVYAIHDESTVSGSSATLVDSMLGDVEKAIMSDTTRDGLARTCEIEAVQNFRQAEGQGFWGGSVLAKIGYSHLYSSPFEARA